MWECMLGYHAFPYMSTPSFVFQYTFDGAQLVCASVPFLNMKGHDGMGKPTTEAELKYAVESIRNLTTTFQGYFLFGVCINLPKRPKQLVYSALPVIVMVYLVSDAGAL